MTIITSNFKHIVNRFVYGKTNIKFHYYSIDSYTRVKQIANNRKQHKSKSIISFFGSDEHNILTKSDVKWFLEKPTYRFISYLPQIGVVKVLIFNTYLEGHIAKLKMHFFGQKLFFYSYDFTDLSKSDKYKLVNQICLKYIDNLNYSVKDDCITDANNSKLFIDDEVGFSLHFLHNVESGFFKNIK